MKQTTVKRLVSILSISLTALVVCFAFVYGRSLISKTSFEVSNDKQWMIVVASVLFVCFYLLLSIHWLWACRQVDAHADKRQFVAFFASQPYKYLPTSLFTFSFRAKFAKDLGLSFKQSTYAQALENFNIIFGGITLGVVALCFSESVVLGLLSVIGVVGALLGAYKFQPQLRVPRSNTKIMLQKLIPGFLLATGAWFIGGIAFVCVDYAINDSVDVLHMIAANSLSYTAGILAFFAPGGVGIRELVFDLFSVTASSIILWRVMTFVVDIILGLVSILLIKKWSN